jgi:hypothetical protein
MSARPASAPPLAFDPITDDLDGAKAVEVAALLGDSVVGVKHCVDPRGGKITPHTWALAAAGLTSIVVSGVAFALSVSTAAFNKAGLDYWTHVANKPAHAYRPRMLDAAYDWVAFGGLALGLIALAVALVRMRRETQSPFFRVGTAPGVELPLDTAPSADFPLVAPKGDDFIFNYGPGIDGELVVEGQTLPLAELAASGRARPSETTAGAFELPLPAHAKIRARSGQTTFLVSAVARPRQHAAPLFGSLESRTTAYFAGSLAAHVGLVLLLAQIPVDGGALAVDLAMTELVDTRYKSGEHEDLPPEPIEQDQGGGGSEGAGAAMALPEGQAGTDKSNNVDGHMRIKNNDLDPQIARLQAIEAARNAGILGSSSALTGAFASVIGTADLSSGPDGADVWGPIFGADGEGYGTFGFGRSGFGLGGGCTQEPCGIIGTEPGYGKIGLGKFGRDGWGGPGSGIPGTRKRTAQVPGPVIGQPTGSGDLDKAIIRRYIKRNVDKIAYCYERELLAKPGIHGEVLVSFFITPTGGVQQATGKGFDASVANCVAGVIGRIEFPRPTGGGGVQVNYPFIFNPAGA